MNPHMVRLDGVSGSDPTSISPSPDSAVDQKLLKAICRVLEEVQSNIFELNGEGLHRMTRLSFL